MAKLHVRLTPVYLSDIAWDQWIEAIEAELPAARAFLTEAAEACEKTRDLMEHNTGSVNFSTLMFLYVAIRNLQPLNIFEIGTFIGKSTLAMAAACDRNANEPRIYTCDDSNPFHLPQLCRTPVKGLPKMGSTVALEALARAGAAIDFVHVDGRIRNADLDLLERVSDDRLVLALDDFEGGEKGVQNCILLRQRQRYAGHALLYPPSQASLRKLGLVSRSTTALLLPMSMVGYANQ